MSRRSSLVAPPVAPLGATTGRWLVSVDRAMSWLYVVLLLSSLSTTLPGLIRAAPSLSPSAWLAVGTLVATAVGTAGIVLAGRERRLAGGVVIVLATASCVTLSIGLTQEPPAVAWWPVYLIITLEVFVITCLAGWWRWLGVGAIALSSLLHEARAARFQGWVPTQLAIELGSTLMFVSTTVVVFGGLRACAVEADRVTELGEQRRSAEAIVAAAMTQRETTERFIHDVVVHALRAVTLVGEGVTVDAARDRCATAAAALREQAERVSSEDLLTAVKAMSRESPLELAIAGARVHVPPTAQAALVSAAREALRNVQLHAGTPQAVVRVAPLTGGARVTITDEGRGFSAAPDYGHRGISSSIVSQMEAVGGTAVVTSTPGRGTVVTLEWSREPVRLPPMPALLAQLSRRGHRVFVMTPLPALLATYLSVVVLPRHLLHPALVIVAASVLLLVGLLLSAQGANAYLGSFGAFSVFVVATGTSLVNVWALPVGSTDPQQYWLAGGGATLMMLVVFFRRMFEAILYALLHSLVTIAVLEWRLGLRPVFQYFMPSVSAQFVALGGALAIRFVMDRLGGQAEVRSQEDADIAQRIESLRLRMRAVGQRLGRLAEVERFLDAVANGGADPRHPETRNLAHGLELALRDELHVHVPVPAAVADRLLALRLSGWHVRLNLTGPLLASACDPLAAALTRLRPDAAGSATVSVNDGKVMLVVEPASAGAGLEFAPGTLSLDEAYAAYEAPLSAAIESPSAVDDETMVS